MRLLMRHAARQSAKLALPHPPGGTVRRLWASGRQPMGLSPRRWAEKAWRRR